MDKIALFRSIPGNFESIGFNCKKPYDMGVAYAYIDGQWLECIADEYAYVHGRSEREWSLILDEWREQQRQYGKKRVTVNGPLLAHFLEEVMADEEVLLQQQRDHEAQSIRETTVGKSNGSSPEQQELETEQPVFVVDMARIPHYEEYR